MSCDGDRRITWLVPIKDPLTLVTKSAQSAKGTTKEAGQQRLMFPQCIPLLSYDLQLRGSSFLFNMP